MASPCNGCNGNGYITVERGTTDGKTVKSKETCKRCGGSGTDPKLR